MSKQKFTKWMCADVSPWRFWDPRSGFRGGVIMSLVVCLLIWCVS